MMRGLTTYFGLPDDKPEVVRLAAKFLGLFMSMAAVISISATFYLIFVAEALGHGSYMNGLTLAGVLIVIQKAVQTLFDYPTGTLGDLFGQRWILFSAFMTYAIAFYLVSLATSSSPFILFAAIYILMGFAGSQESGALDSWFDNNYSVAVPEDEDKKQYGVFIGKLAMLIRVARAIVILLGAMTAVIIARAFVFELQSVICAIIAVLSLILVADLPIVQDRQETEDRRAYIPLMRQSFHHIFGNPYLMYLTLGNTLFMSIGFTWGELIMYPFLYNYLISDLAVASLMSAVIIIFAVLWERSGVWAKRFEPHLWIPRFRFVQSAGAVFFWLFALIMLVFPPPPVGSEVVGILIPFTDFSILQIPVAAVVPVSIILIIWISGGAFFGIAAILWMRVLIDVIPNRIRNGVYSLLPTLVVLAAIPQVAVLGWLAPQMGIAISLVLSGGVSTLGVFFLRKGFQQPRPMGEKMD
ncbi:MAG: MFS transporter [Promethearchaeota archaeon]